MSDDILNLRNSHTVALCLCSNTQVLSAASGDIELNLKKMDDETSS